MKHFLHSQFLTLVFSVTGVLLQYLMSIFPLCDVEPIDSQSLWAAIKVRWAKGGGQHSESSMLPSFGCLISFDDVLGN